MCKKVFLLQNLFMNHGIMISIFMPNLYYCHSMQKKYLKNAKKAFDILGLER